MVTTVEATTTNPLGVQLALTLSLIPCTWTAGFNSVKVTVDHDHKARVIQTIIAADSATKITASPQ